MRNSKETMRVNKFLALQGLCSRREAEELIEKGWISVNGVKVSEQGVKVEVGDEVTVDPKAENWLLAKSTIILNKPPGYVSNLAEKGKEHAIKLITKGNFHGPKKPTSYDLKGMAPAGRLDIDSSGLLILTQNGKLVKKIIGPTSNVEKEYVIKVEGSITNGKIAKLKFGLHLDGKPLKRAKVKRLNETQLSVILTEGKKRQIRRMCELVDLKVLTLKRIRVGEIKLGDLPRGKWRFLRSTEKV